MTKKATNQPLFKKMKLSMILSFTIILSMIMPGIAAADDEDYGFQLYQTFELLAQRHVGGTPPKELAERAIQAMIDSLNDRHTEFMSNEQFNEFIDSVEQNYVGIGIVVSYDEIGFYVADVFENSPAKESGIQRDDYIVSVDGHAVAGKDLEQLATSIRGLEGTSVIVSVKRDGNIMNFPIQRRAVNRPVVESKLFQGGIGYLKLISFSGSSGQEFAEHLDRLQQMGIESLIVDLRDNGGGVLQSAQSIAQLFVEEGILMISKGRDMGDLPLTFSNGDSVDFPVTVLVNQYSASASEMLTGVLQDYGVATVVGTKTYGKGSAQEIYLLASDTALKVTVEEYLTPNGREINNVGLQPDVLVEEHFSQLFTALRMNQDVKNLSLTLGKHAYTLNGAEFIEAIRTVKQEQDIYLPTRVLAALVGGEIRWNDSPEGVGIKTNTNEALFTTASGDELTEEDGTSFIKLSSFAAQFTEMQLSFEGEDLHISVKGE